MPGRGRQSRGAARCGRRWSRRCRGAGPRRCGAGAVSPTTLRVLTSKIVGCHRGAVRDIAVIEDPAAAEVSLDPVRARLLAELAEPASATMLAARVRLPRQKVNYHLRALERHRLVELVEERREGNRAGRV